MAQRINSWWLVLLAAALAAGIGGFLFWSRTGSVPLAELLERLPAEKALTIHVDLAAIRQAGMGELLAGSQVAEEPDYLRFVTESGFDWKLDLDAVTATKSADDWYFFVEGRFDLQKLRNYALSRGGSCKNGVCDVAAVTPGRRISFFPLTAGVLAVASSRSPGAVYAIYRQDKPAWVGGVPEGPAWVSFNGQVLAGDPALPSGGRLFGKVLAETRRTTFAVKGGGAAPLALEMRAHSADATGATNIYSQLQGVTTEFGKYFDRLGQKASPADLSGLLLSGQFTVAGTEVTGRWPLHEEFLKKLAAGEL